VHVAYSSDLGGNVAGLLSSMVSLGRHQRSPGECSIHLIVAREALPEAEALMERFRQELAGLPALPELLLHELREPPLDLGALQQRSEAGELYRSWLVKPQTFARLQLHEYLPAAPRALWLDHDTIVKADLGPLYRMHMEHAVAAAAEWCGPACPLGYYTRKSAAAELVRRGWSLDPGIPAFDTGVVLMDLNRWRSDGLSPQVVDWVRATDAFEGDQAGLNIYFRGISGIDVLNWRWNEQYHKYHYFWSVPWPEACVEEARILHFSGASKPWNPCTEDPSGPAGHLDPTCGSAYRWRVLEAFEQYAVRRNW